MNANYFEVFSELSGEMFIQRNDKNGSICIIPTEPANSDYQAYLAWLENPNAEITPPVL
jgi:hypothetical protein